MQAIGPLVRARTIVYTSRVLMVPGKGRYSPTTADVPAVCTSIVALSILGNTLAVKSTTSSDPTSAGAPARP